MIVNNKMSEIKFEYEIANNKIKFLKVKLLVLKKKKIDLGCVFYKCHSLIHFDLLSSEEVKLENEFKSKEINKKINIINTSEYLYKTYIESEDCIINNNNNKFDNFYSESNESEISKDELEDMFDNIKHSQNFLSFNSN